MGVFQPRNYPTFGKMCKACHSIHGGSAGAQYARMGVGFCIICPFGGAALTN